jgi:hypothetical protein
MTFVPATLAVKWQHMAQAHIITLEKELPGPLAVYMKAGCGKALLRESERLGTAARRRGVTAITSLLSENQSALIEQLKADGFDPAKMRLAPELWHPAAEGLKTVRGLIEWVTANLNDFKQPNSILRDLKSAETLLTAAEAAGIQFHFTNATV